MSEENDLKEIIKKIRNSNNHDDVATDLYEALCPGKTPPYKKWVATWILKCIDKCNKFNTEEKEYLYASFALLEGYTLNGTTIEYRLTQYLKDSDYTTRHDSTRRNRTYQQINDSPDGETEMENMLGNLKRYERKATNILAEYITSEINYNEIPKHIEELDKYGTELKDGAGYRHNPQRLMQPDWPENANDSNMPDLNSSADDIALSQNETTGEKVGETSQDKTTANDEQILRKESMHARLFILLKTLNKSNINVKNIVVLIVFISIAAGIYIFISYNKKLEQIRHKNITYSDILNEEVSSEDPPLDKPIFEKIAVYNDEEEKIKRIQLRAGESSVLSAHFSPDDADANNLDISSEDTSKLNIKIIDTGIPGELPFLAKAEAREDTERFPTSILVEGPGAIPACVNVYIKPNNLAHYGNEDMKNSRVSENGGLDSAE